MRWSCLLVLAGCHGGASADPAPVPHAKPGALASVPHAKLCVTKGTVDEADGGVLTIDTPTTRAVAPGSSGEAASLKFTYRGESRDTRALASGQMRHQLGIKLRAADGCNVVYVMWRVEPRSFIEVSVKRNPGMRTHAECGAGGYTKIKPTTTAAVPGFVEGAAHTLEAAIDGDTLTAKVDGEVVWEGTLDPGARALDGPAGFRSDNVAYEAVFSAAPGGSTKATPGCPGGDTSD